MEGLEERPARDRPNVFRAQLSQAGELISVPISGILLEKEADLRFPQHRFANLGPRAAQLAARLRISDHARATVVSGAELARCERVEERLPLLRRGDVPAGNIVMKEQMQVA